MKELRNTIEVLKGRLNKNVDGYTESSTLHDLLFLIEKQDEYIKKLEKLVCLVSEIDK